MDRVLNVGGASREIPLPPEFAGFEQLLLDIDPEVAPDIVCDARRLTTLEPGTFDAVYCSHNLEHFYRHEVPVVLAGFLHVLREGGFAHITVPDITAVMKQAIERNLDLEDTLYQSPAGPITPMDVVYGYGPELERSGNDYYAHKTGFTLRSLLGKLQDAGFVKIYGICENLEVRMIAFKGAPDPRYRLTLNLGPG